MLGQLGHTRQYKDALAALNNLRGQMGVTDELKALAAYLFYSEGAEVPEAMFPFVGVLNDPRDQNVIKAYREEWQRLNEEDGDD